MDVMNGKPSWDDAPVWANWLAMDFNGIWCWYESEPAMSLSINGIWVTKDSDIFETASYPDNMSELLSLPEWRLTLERRPKGGTNGTVD